MNNNQLAKNTLLFLF